MTVGRRLAAVMFTDLVEYTALSQRDEARTLAVLAEHRAIVRPLIARFGGREVKTTGDGFLVEFESALHATLCAVEIQARSQEWRRAARGDRPFVRIAVHVGDVVPEGDDILGDAVNIAARIEPLADPGGVCVSGAVYEQVVNKVPHKFEQIPTPVLKGVSSPLEVYRLLRAGADIGPSHRASPANRIAVLPLASISPDPHDEYLADGMTDELINTLSRIGGLGVIARTSVDHYKERSKPLPQVGAELNVGSVLEGSVRRAGNKLRVSVQLIDVPSQSPTWAHQYDRDLDDVFAIQSEIARQVAESLRVRVPTRARERVPAPRPVATASYLAYLKARSQLHHLTLAGADEARRQFQEAIRLDPNNARALAGLADATYLRALLRDVPFSEVIDALGECKALVGRSLEIDPDAAEAHASLGHFHDELLEFADAERELRTAIGLNPALATARRYWGRHLIERGRLEAALEELLIAEEADPLSPDIESVLARLLFALDRPDEARAKLHRLAELEPDGMQTHLVRFENAQRGFDLPALRREVAWFSEHAPSGSPEARAAYWHGLAAAIAGDGASAHRAIATLRAARETGSDRPLVWATEQMAEIHANLGETDACFALLDAAFASRALALEHWWLSASFGEVRRDPRFERFLERARLA